MFRRLIAWIKERLGIRPKPYGLVNPVIPPGPNRVQEWYFAEKAYDGTFRIRWPTYFADQAGKGSWTMVGEYRAEFRSYWIDEPGARRPSYTMPIRELPATVICVLYSADGEPLAWFRTPTSGAHRGHLPEGPMP